MSKCYCCSTTMLILIMLHLLVVYIYYLINEFLGVHLFVCWVICFQSQTETSKLSPEVASILAAYLRN